MKLSGGNYGGYTLVDDEVVLYDENNLAADIQTVAVSGTDIIVNGWIYNEDGIFIGTE